MGILQELTRHISTPFYAYDLNQLEERTKSLKETLSTVEIFYAMKANASPILLRLLKN